MSERIAARVLVVGGGPGGYSAAIRAGRLGLDTVLVEAGRLGGTCLIRGCIPSKALIHAAGQFAAMREAVAGGGRFGISLNQPPMLDFGETRRWIESVVGRLETGVAGLLRRAGVRVMQGWGRFFDAKTCHVATEAGEVTVTAEHVILATGSEPVALPSLPFGGAVLSSTEALSLPGLPRRLAVIGAGYIGLELGTAFRKLGVEVTVIEAQNRILPLWDEELTEPVRRWLDRAGVRLHLGAQAQALQDGPDGAVLMVRTGDGGSIKVAADQVLCTVGRRPRTQGWGIEAMAVDLEGGFVRVDDQCRTSMRNVWAIGDLVGEPMLAHKAMAQGETVAEIIAGARRHFAPAAIPAVCFTEPEIVSAGMLPAEAASAGIDAVVAAFPFAANGRALTLGGEGEGFVRVVARRDTGRLLGLQAVGAQIAELAAGFAHALEMGAMLEDLAATIHVHPTLSEAVREAAARALGRAIHV
ncbi:MAG: dihydrolipoyl dehydrogenase [Alphaproteobacteria bacterium]|nr:dihydrolipoyl dehydrogenase [Alphaproteobacteria bacterium]MBV9863136.1 dihydrolipoyl dehydrogenase [Alphaproteobacteria bacterium]